MQRVGSLFQLPFAGFWLARGALATGWHDEVLLAALLAALAVLAFSLGIVATQGRTPRPEGTRSGAIERSVTIATALQLAASFALPAAAAAGGRVDLVLAAVVVSVGPLLLYLHGLLRVPRYLWLGVTETVGPVLLVLLLHGAALTAVTGLGFGLAAFATATFSLRDVRRLPIG